MSDVDRDTLVAPGDTFQVTYPGGFVRFRVLPARRGGLILQQMTEEEIEAQEAKMATRQAVIQAESIVRDAQRPDQHGLTDGQLG